ncbi:MAG: peroxide stress protein YaaA [Rhodospirillaceae bacterium]|nr:peroxide stress protein YaaA [Rhodospirillaceae bacterium]
MADTLCFLSCCKRKTKCPDDPVRSTTLTDKRIPETWRALQAGRKGMSTCLEREMRPCAALHQYDGGLYNSDPDFRELVERHLESGRLDLYIISAGYGLVHALDPIQPYEAEMKGRVATFWRDVGLTAVISDLVRNSRSRRVFGFFAGPSHWSGAHAKYRYFFTEGVNEAVAMGATVDTAACFYREDGRGTNAITGALGRALLRGIRATFSSGFLNEYAIGRPDGNVIIRSETIRDSV